MLAAPAERLLCPKLIAHVGKAVAAVPVHKMMAATGSAAAGAAATAEKKSLASAACSGATASVQTSETS
eukprot:6209353-Pleurochrysis_carterae.AAC.1